MKYNHRNHEIPTVELNIQRALGLSKAVSKDNSVSLSKMAWKRCSRTDRGVSSVGLITTVKMDITRSDIIESINSYLPEDIRIFGMHN